MTRCFFSSTFLRARDKFLTETTEYAEQAPEDPKLVGCMTPSEKWKGVRLNDPDGIVLEIWQRL